MVILGIDPGLATIGYGVVDYRNPRFTTLDYGVLTTPAGHRVEERLKLIYEGMNTLLDTYRPEEMSVEELFFNNNHTTGILVAEARGVLLMAAEQHGVKIFEYNPMQVKQAVTGYGKAEKNQVITMVMSMLNIRSRIKPDDAADALALAVCHAHSGTSRIRDFYNQN